MVKLASNHLIDAEMKQYIFLILIPIIASCSKSERPIEPPPPQRTAVPWNQEQAFDQALGVTQLLKKWEHTISYAVEHNSPGNISVNITKPLTSILQDWHEQRIALNNEEAEKYSECNSAALDFQFYSLTFTEAESAKLLEDRERRLFGYQNSLKECKKVVLKNAKKKIYIE